MYLKLGNLKSKYPKTQASDFMIYSEVPDSRMSFESPKLVRNITELDVWFGKDFPQRSYYEELLRYSGVSLYLFKPTLEGLGNPTLGWTELGDMYYWKDGDLWKIVGGEYILAPTVKSRLYKVHEPGGKLLDKETGLRYNTYVAWLETGDWTLPEEVKAKKRFFVSPEDYPHDQTPSNRDTLQINVINKESEYCHWSSPMYYSSGEIIPFGQVGSVDCGGLDYERLDKGYMTFAFTLDYTDRELHDGEYLVINTKGGSRVLFGKLPVSVSTKYYDKEVQVTTVGDILGRLENLGYHKIGNTLYATFPCPTTYFYKIQDFVMEPNLGKSYHLLSTPNPVSPVTPRITFWSKTIGAGEEGGEITVSIENLDASTHLTLERPTSWAKFLEKAEDTPDGRYRIILRRYDYEEVFEGTAVPGIGEERLDYTISRESLLVGCSIDGSGPILEGTWTLRGATEERYTVEHYRNSMNRLLSEETIHPDYFLIGDLNKYDPTEAWWSGTLDLLKASRCQALIQNTPEDYKDNFTRDPENWIVYFLGEISLGWTKRPGYYLYLKGLMEDVYSYTTDKILCETPETDCYGGVLKKYEESKCNYLTDNGHIYYYRTYFNGPSPVTTAWMRFAIEKVGRELEKNKWSFLGEPMTTKIKGRIEKVLEGVNSNFGIIRGIQVTDYNMVPGENLIYLSINLSVSDLVSNDITLDLTINFNK